MRKKRALLACCAALPVLGLSAAQAGATTPRTPAHTEQQARAQAGCPRAMIFEVGGHLDGDAAVYDRGNARLPADVAFTKVHYSASIAPYPGDSESLDDSVAEGTAALDSAVERFHDTCPGSRLTISGYSEGAIVAGDELAALSEGRAVPHGRINGVLYGDPRRPGTERGPGGIETDLPTFWPGMTMKGPRGFGDLTVKEVCNTNDGICYSADAVTDPACFTNGVAGYLTGDHEYSVDPYAVSGGGDQLNRQTPKNPRCRRQRPGGTADEPFGGGLAEARRFLSGYRTTVARLLPPSYAGGWGLPRPLLPAAADPLGITAGITARSAQ